MWEQTIESGLSKLDELLATEVVHQESKSSVGLRKVENFELRIESLSDLPSLENKRVRISVSATR